MKKDVSGLNVAVLAGGPGNERAVSLASGNGVVKALQGVVGKVELVDISGSDFELPGDVDICFNVVHGTFGEDGVLQSELTRRGVAFTGAREASSRLAFDKVKSKERFVAHKVCTPKSSVVMVDECNISPVGLPCVVKPPREGSSVGVHLVHTQEQWDAAVVDAGKYSDDILVEELIVGKELTVGIVGTVALPIVHIQPRSGFYDMRNKYPWMTGVGGSDYYCPAELSPELTQLVQKEALKAHQSLEVEVYSRVDVMLSLVDNQPYVLEVNTLPGMTESSLLPKAAAAAGMDYPALCLKILLHSLDLDN